MNYHRFEGESDEALIYRVCSDKDQIGTWQDVADILNGILFPDGDMVYTESAYRKRFQMFQKMMDANREKFVDSSAQLSEIENKIRELRREQIKFRDERNAWQKQNYADSRVCQTLDLLEERLSDFHLTGFEPHSIPCEPDGEDKEMIVVLSDLHIGQSFNSLWGEYNTDIASERLVKFYMKVLSAGRLHNVSKVHVLSAGDLISGNIHKTIQITNKENVVDQIKRASELISSFCYELTKDFSQVYFYNVSGNHSRIDRKDDALKDERLDDIISWSVGLALSNVTNFHNMSMRNLDTGIVDMNVCGKSYIGVHGDYDSATSAGISNLVMMLGFIPYAVIRGHNHHASMDNINGVQVYTTPSLAGSGDDYTVQKRLCGNPGQTFFICDSNGIECTYNVDLI